MNVFKATAGIVCLALLYVTITAEKCKPGYTCPVVPDTSIKPEHGQLSPLASKVFLQLHSAKDSCPQQSAVKLFVQYTPDMYSDDFIAMMHNDKKIVLRDDGVYPDKTKDDQEYTAIIPLDTAQLRELYNRTPMLSAQAAGKAQVVDFREVKPASSDQMRTLQSGVRFDFAAFRQGGKTELIYPDAFTVEPNIRSNSLYLTTLDVVEDPTRTWNPRDKTGNVDGIYSIKTVMAGLANTAKTGITAEEFMLQWLETWLTASAPNGDPLDVRTGMKASVIDPWITASGNTRKLDWKKAPFKLLAVVNRLDLMDNPIFPSGENGGEFRLVFGILDQNFNAQLSVVIFEFGVPKSGSTLFNYAKEWSRVRTLNTKSEEYKAAIAKIAQEIIKPDGNAGKPNGSNINQVRTNELFVGSPWQLREFNIDPATKLLKNVTVKMTPAEKWHQKPELAKYINDRLAAVEQNRYKINDTLDDKTTPLMASNNTFFRNGDGVWRHAPAQPFGSNQARFVLSLNTCGGCHQSEGHNGSFLHNRSASFGAQASLSPFIIGGGSGPLGQPNVPSKRTDVTGVERSFNDLDRRSKILWEYTNSIPLLFGLKYNPVRMEH